MNFGRRVYDIRKRIGISQKELANLAGISAGALSKIESGVLDPSFETVIAILTALEIQPQEFFARDTVAVSAGQKSEQNGKVERKRVDLLLAVRKMTPVQKHFFMKIVNLVKSSDEFSDNKKKTLNESL